MRIEVLDHGYCELVESWGSDEHIVEAARMSTGKGFLGWGTDATINERRERFSNTCGVLGYMTKAGPTGANLHPDRCSCQGDDTTPHKHYSDRSPFVCARCAECKGYAPAVPGVGDEKLLAYLWKNAHHTPFEMAGATFEIQAPIMVFREHHRHRTQSYNELSARYTPLPDLNYLPTVERALLNSKVNKQAGTIAGADELTETVASELLEEERAFNVAAEKFYQKKLKAGFPKELARTHLGVSRYSRMRASANLRNWLAFLTLRDDKNAQWEIRSYAKVVRQILAEKFPRTLSLWSETKGA